MKKTIGIIVYIIMSIQLIGGKAALELTAKREINISEFVKYKVDSIIANKQGELYLLDAKACRVHKLAENGDYLFSFGQPGQGPGDLHMPIWLTLTENEDIAVGTRLNGVKLFDSNGNPIDKELPPGNPRMVRWIGGKVFSCEGSAGNNRKQKHMIMDSDGNILLNDINTIDITGVDLSNGGFISWMRIEYSPLLKATTAYGIAALAQSNEYRITLINHKGDIMRVIERDVPAPAISKDEKAWLQEKIRKGLPEEAQKAIIEQIPLQKNYIADLNISPHNLWVLRVADDIRIENSMKTIDVFCLDGNYLYTVKTEKWPLLITDKKMLCLEMDENELGYILAEYSYLIKQNQ